MFIYRLMRFITFPFLKLFLRLKYRHDLSKYYERIGRPTEDRPKADIVWLHCPTPLKAVGIVAELRNVMPEKTILLTYNSCENTVDLGDHVIYQHAPIDAYFPVRNFLNFWEPSVAIRTGSELWPVQLSMLKKLNIPSFLLNAKISSKSYRIMKLVKRMIRRTSSDLTFVWAVNNKEALRFANLGAMDIMSQDLIETNKIRTIFQKIVEMLNRRR